MSLIISSISIWLYDLFRTATPSNRPESMMSMSTDILSNRRAISASRLRPTNHLGRTV